MNKLGENKGAEERIIEKIFGTIGDGDKWCVEFGAWDGKVGSNTYNLITNKGWSGVLIESEPKKFQRLLFNYKNNGKIICLNKFVNFDGQDTLDNILANTPIPKNFNLLSIDIDGNDYHVWDSIKIYSPKVVIIEFNPSIPINIEFIQKKDTRINHGSSLLSIVNLGKKKGYELVNTTSFNAFFLKKEYFPLFGLVDNSPKAIYREHKFQTQIFQLFDGTLVLSGCKRLIWHGIEIKQERIQILPRFLRVFPGKMNPFLAKLLKHGWRGIFKLAGRVGK